ncbi:MAG: hypothetical protein V1798_08785 [Pseudomonadota bacterium]
MRRGHVIACGVAAAIGLSVTSVRADSIFGEFKRLPDKIERGFSVGFDFGLMFLTGEKQSATNPGFNLAFTTGYDLMKYFGLEGVYNLAITQADPLDPLLQGSTMNFSFNACGKLQLPLDRFYPFIEAGPGITYSRPSWIAGESKKLDILLAGGFEYYTYLRHYSLYMKATYTWMDLPVKDFIVAAGLKYTF